MSDASASAPAPASRPRPRPTTGTARGRAKVPGSPTGESGVTEVAQLVQEHPTGSRLPVSELLFHRAGAASPFGDDLQFPLPAGVLNYHR